jgi:YD repeat-containing protein
MSSVKFSYDISGAVTEELLLSGVDTLTIVRYVYAGGKLIAVRTLRKDGTLRFTDSLLYDGQGRKIEEQRISSAGVKTFYHRYTLNAFGKTSADSLYELVSTAFVATQAVLFTYNPDSTVVKEVQWRMSSATWYCISTAFMSYAAGSLVSVATHERDGIGTGMTDSLAYSYDGFGNRTKEEDYNGSKVLTHRIVYTWRDTLPVLVLMSEKMRSDQRSVLSCNQGRLTADLSAGGRGMIALYDMSGRRICQTAVEHSGIVPLNGMAGKGSYVAVYTRGTGKQVLTFTKYN